MNPYDTLGISRTATLAEAKAAYRALASKYHPDKEPDETKKIALEEKFKVIKGAFEMIDNGWREPTVSVPRQSKPQRWTKPEPVFHGFYDPTKPPPWQAAPKPRASPNLTPRASPNLTPRAAPKIIEAHAPLRPVACEFIARPSMGQAYNGFTLQVNLDSRVVQIQMPRGIPHGLRNTFSIGDEDITVTILFTQSEYEFVGLNEAIREATYVNSEPAIVYRTRNLRYNLTLSAASLRYPQTIEALDFLGEKYKIQIPANHNPRNVIVVPGRGYVDWYTSRSEAGTERGDVLVRVHSIEEVSMQFSAL